MGSSDDLTAQEASGAGLCYGCRHSKRVEGKRESVYYLCERSLTDSRFAKYPRLPVLQCPGYEPRRGG
jgi:hypothetical protein